LRILRSPAINHHSNACGGYSMYKCKIGKLLDTALSHIRLLLFECHFFDCARGPPYKFLQSLSGRLVVRTRYLFFSTLLLQDFVGMPFFLAIHSPIAWQYRWEAGYVEAISSCWFNLSTPSLDLDALAHSWKTLIQAFDLCSHTRTVTAQCSLSAVTCMSSSHSGLCRYGAHVEFQ
jgi:hypothetical protein